VSCITYDDVTPSLFDTWNEQAQLGSGGGGCTGPMSPRLQWVENKELEHEHNREEQCQVIQIDTELHLPGLKVLSQSMIGVKLLFLQQETQSSNGDDDDGSLLLPEYQFTLLDSQLIPSGPAPLVWLFKQLTKYRSTTSSFTRVRALYHHHENAKNLIYFVTEARLETRIRVPSLIAKRLSYPTLVTFEKQGSEAVQKMLETELEPALLKFYHEYCTFISSYSSSFL